MSPIFNHGLLNITPKAPTRRDSRTRSRHCGVTISSGRYIVILIIGVLSM